MGKPKRGRGRPPSPQARSAAERMRAYRARKRAAGLKAVTQWLPRESEGGGMFSDHRILEARSLAMHCVIARKIARDPVLLTRARANLDRWRRRAGDAPPSYLDEWESILARPWPAVAAFITGFGEQAVRLRQSSPFAGVLTPSERRRIYDAFRA